MKLYGGPAHGRHVPPFSVRYEVLVNPEPHRYRRSRPDEPVVYWPQDTRSYYVERYGERRANPQRARVLEVGVLDGAALRPEEIWELSRDLERKPWEFPPASILDEFDEWFAQAWYRQTGELSWKGERLHE